MRTTRSDRRKRTHSSDFTAWLQANSETNDLQLERMRRSLRIAREQELTPRQQEVLALYYNEQLTIAEIARRLEVNTSTVCRTLERARKRLRRALRYCT